MNTQTLTPSPGTTASADRILVVDALRGFALFGILLVHVAMFYYAGFPPKPISGLMQEGLGNQIAMGFVQIFADSKFYTIFSFLFGLSFAIQMIQSKEKQTTFLGRFAWRLLILGMIGFAHQMHWRGDILMIYATLGFVLLLTRNLPDRLLLVVGLLLIINLPGFVQNVYEAVQSKGSAQQGPPPGMEAEAEKYYQLVKTGSYAQIARTNITEIQGKIQFQLWSGRLYITFGCFLLGLYAGRRKIFHRLEENRTIFRKICRYSILTVVGLIAVGLGLFLAFNRPNTPPPAFLMPIASLLYYTATAAMTIFYVTGVSLLLQKARWQGMLRALVPVGKMGLTTYVLQSVIGTLIFYGYGLNLIGQMQAWQAALLTLPIFVAQIMFSKWWLSKYQYGPLEWLWRSLTYLKIQPLRAKKVALSS